MSNITLVDVPQGIDPAMYHFLNLLLLALKDAYDRIETLENA